MAKEKAGLPAGFDLGVSIDDVDRPVSLPSYLDYDPAVDLARERAKIVQTQAVQVAPPVQVTPRVESRPSVPTLEPQRAKVAPQAPEQKTTDEVLVARNKKRAEQRAQMLIRRLQVNLTAEVERQAHELLELLSAQSADNRITVSEVIQGLIMSLFEARGEINISMLPQRGRWGSPTAKSFPSELAHSFKEAIVSLDQKLGPNAFRKASGA